MPVNRASSARANRSAARSTKTGQYVAGSVKRQAGTTETSKTSSTTSMSSKPPMSSSTRAGFEKLLKDLS